MQARCSQNPSSLTFTSEFIYILSPQVREGASLVAVGVVVEGCRQGIMAYGGARSARIHACTITGCSHEGVLAAGTFDNAATRVQQHAGMRSRSQATRDAEAWGKKQGIELQVRVGWVCGGCESDVIPVG